MPFPKNAPSLLTLLALLVFSAGPCCAGIFKFPKNHGMYGPAEPAFSMPFDQPGDALTAAHEVLDELFAKLGPSTRSSCYLMHGACILQGDLLGDGQSYALIRSNLRRSVTLKEDHDGSFGAMIAFAKWNGKQWDLKSVCIDAGAPDEPKDWKAYPLSTKEAGFELKAASGKNVTDLILEIPTGLNRRPVYSLFHFDRETRELHRVASSDEKPQSIAGYWNVSYTDWPHPNYTEWHYFQDQGHELVERAVWRDVQNYNDPDVQYMEAVLPTEGGATMVYHILGSQENQRLKYTITRDEKPFGEISFRIHEVGNDPTDFDGQTLRHLFHSLTGLPPRCCPSIYFDKDFKHYRYRLEFEVTGSDEAKRVLTPAQ